MRWQLIVILSLLVSSGNAVWAQGARRESESAAPAKLTPKLTKPPALVRGAVPRYPEQARALALTEAVRVKVRIHIGADGLVTQVDILEPVGNGFDEAAIAAAKQYRFTPAEWDGVPGPIQVETTIPFEVPPPEPPPLPPTPPRSEIGKTPDQPPSHVGAYTQPVSLEGVAVERGTRKPLAGVTVALTAELGDVITDAQGRFYFHDVKPGTYPLVAVASGYDRFRRTISIAKDEKLEVKLWMRPRGGNPYETVVEGEREAFEVTRRRLERRQMTTVPGTFGDPIRVIQSLPGLARTPFVSGFLVIRGSNPDDTGIYIDGHRIPLIFHFLGGPSILNPEFLDSIDLYPGGFPARFGRAGGGVVAVETRDVKSDGVHGSADVDILDAGAYLRVPLGKKGAVAVAGRRSYFDLVLDFFLPEQDDGDVLLVSPVYYDYQGRADYDLGRHGKVSLLAFGSSDRLDVLSENEDDENFFNLNSQINFFRVIGNYRRPLSDKLTLSLSPSYGRDSVTFAGSQFSDSDTFTGLELKQSTFGYRARIQGRLSKSLAIDAGLDLESRVTRYEITASILDDIRTFGDPDAVDGDPELTTLSADVFGFAPHIDIAWNPTEKLQLIPGLRFDAYTLNGRVDMSFDPRLVAKYTIDNQWLAKAYTGVFHQPPQPEGLDVRFGNPELTQERSIHLGAGAEYKPTKNWSLDGEVYYINRANLATFTDEVRVDDDTGEVVPLNFANTRQGDTVGLEVLIKREVSQNLFGWLSYTLSWTRSRQKPEDDYAPTAFDQRHTLNAVASYSTDSGWEIGARYRLSTGRPDTPIIGSTFDADANSYTPLQGDERSSRFPTFSQLDVRFEKTWLFNAWRIGAYLDVQNALNADNREATQYDYRFRESAPVRGIPFLPTLGVRGQW